MVVLCTSDICGAANLQVLIHVFLVLKCSCKSAGMATRSLIDADNRPMGRRGSSAMVGNSPRRRKLSSSL